MRLSAAFFQISFKSSLAFMFHAVAGFSVYIVHKAAKCMRVYGQAFLCFLPIGAKLCKYIFFQENVQTSAKGKSP